MSGETIEVWLDQITTLEQAGGALPNGSLALASNGPYDKMASGFAYPDAQFVLVGQFITAPVENSYLSLYARPLDIFGTNDAEVPEASRPTRLIGNFVVNNVTTLQTMELVATDLPRKAEYYVHNNGTGQSLAAGWVLQLNPRSYKAAP